MDADNILPSTYKELIFLILTNLWPNMAMKPLVKSKKQLQY